MSVGIPFMGGAHDPDLWRLGRLVHRGDLVQVAMDNTAGDDRMYVCLLGPTDDFGYADEERAACTDRSEAEVIEGKLDRQAFTYARATGFPLLQVRSYYHRLNTYTLNVEHVVTRVNLGIQPTTVRRRRFDLRFTAVFGDNTLATDGIAGAGYYRYKTNRGTRTRWKKFVLARTAGGGLRFKGRIPSKVSKRSPQLRFCVQQPGGSTRRCASRSLIRVKLR